MTDIEEVEVIKAITTFIDQQDQINKILTGRIERLEATLKLYMQLQYKKDVQS